MIVFRDKITFSYCYAGKCIISYTHRPKKSIARNILFSIVKIIKRPFSRNGSSGNVKEHFSPSQFRMKFLQKMNTDHPREHIHRYAVRWSKKHDLQRYQKTIGTYLNETSFWQTQLERHFGDYRQERSGLILGKRQFSPIDVS